VTQLPQLTGKDIHKSYLDASTGGGKPWDQVHPDAQARYGLMAEALNHLLYMRGSPEKGNYEKPQFAILVVGGVVQHIVSEEPSLLFRRLDMDNAAVGEDVGGEEYTDVVPDINAWVIAQLEKGETHG